MVLLSLRNRFSELFGVFKLILARWRSKRIKSKPRQSRPISDRAESFNSKIDISVPDLQNFQW